MTKTPREIILMLLNNGFSQNDIAKKAQVSQATISRIAAGKNDTRSAIKARLESISKIASELNHE